MSGVRTFSMRASRTRMDLKLDFQCLTSSTGPVISVPGWRGILEYRIVSSGNQFAGLETIFPLRVGFHPSQWHFLDATSRPSWINGYPWVVRQLISIDLHVSVGRFESFWLGQESV